MDTKKPQIKVKTGLLDYIVFRKRLQKRLKLKVQK